ncbi:hypothetical protein HY768_00720 [candidate division TA06 bacterium]|uniref:Outer membrane protein beta-barrel domain-containing protein n=1 Tax=candidate division TA06 bacterium TaxID=2250710 RepID=A0A933I8H2_UNCT6|nr:hypothetical protein [candidate division TA06 bacterium]
MKKALLAVMFVTVVSSWCLAQTDSLPTPKAEPCPPATCAEPFVPKWAVGMKASALTNFPGSIIVEKMYGFNNSLRLIVNGDYNNDDNYYIFNNWWVSSGVKYYHRFNFDRLQFIKPSFGLGLIYTRREDKRQYSNASDYQHTYYNKVGLCMPLALIHYFKVTGNNFAAGVEADIFNITVEQRKEEIRDISTGQTDTRGPDTDVQAYLFDSPYFVIKYFFK